MVGVEIPGAQYNSKLHTYLDSRGVYLHVDANCVHLRKKLIEGMGGGGRWWNPLVIALLAKAYGFRD